MSRHHYIIGVGSNWEADKNIEYALHQFKYKYTNICISTLQKTVPIGMNNDYMFTNCVVSIYCNEKFDEINSFLKALERECGRVSEDKPKGIIKLDLDIIIADGVTLKEDDLKREYILYGINEINNMKL